MGRADQNHVAEPSLSNPQLSLWCALCTGVVCFWCALCIIVVCFWCWCALHWLLNYPGTKTAPPQVLKPPLHTLPHHQHQHFSEFYQKHISIAEEIIKLKLSWQCIAMLILHSPIIIIIVIDIIIIIIAPIIITIMVIIIMVIMILPCNVEPVLHAVDCLHKV